MTEALTSLGVPVASGLFVFAAVGVLVAGTRLTYLADAISERFKLSKSLMGLLFLATATSLPEIATTFGAALRESKELVLNNLYGGVALQTAILALADFWVRGSITYYPRRMNHLLEVVLLILLLTFTLLISLLDGLGHVAHVGLGSLFIGGAYASAIWFLRKQEANGDWQPVDAPHDDDRQPNLLAPVSQLSGRTLLLQTFTACFAVFLFGTLLVISAEALSVSTELGAGFVGATFLAAATSLPELTTSIAAVRFGAYTLAISNIFGSNLIMLGLVLPADFLFRPGPILADPSATVVLSLAFGILVSAIYLVGLVVRKKPRIGPLGLDSALVIVAFAASIFAYYHA